MRNNSLSSAVDAYDKKYLRPMSDIQAIQQIISIYTQLMGTIATQSTQEGIAENYRELISKGIPAYYWFLEAIHRASKKKEEKRHFGYIIGMIRNWVVYGFGNTMTEEENEVMLFFKEITGQEISNESRIIISALMGRFGAIKTMRHLVTIPDKTDLSLVYAEKLAKSMIETYEPNSKEHSIIVEETQSRIKISPTDSNHTRLNREPYTPYIEEEEERIEETQVIKNGKRKYMTNPEEREKFILAIEEYLVKRVAAKPRDIAEYLIRNGYDEFVTKNNITSKLQDAIIRSQHIVNVSRGLYAYK